MCVPQKTCPICTTTSQFAFETSYHRIQRCGNKGCRHLFAEPSVAFRGVMSPENDTTDYTIYEKRNNHLIRYWQRHGFIRDQFRILDFGSGTGHIVRSLKQQMKVDVTCVEAGEVYHSKLKALGCRVLKNLDEINTADKYDAALLIEVIEHLDRPVEILNKIWNHLKIGAKLFLTTPGGDFRCPVKDPQKLGAYNTPHHIQFFTPTSLPYALRLAGFQRYYYRFVNEMYPDETMSQNDYESFWAKRTALKKLFHYWAVGSYHLTYFAKK